MQGIGEGRRTDETGCGSWMRLRRYDREDREVFSGSGKCDGVDGIVEGWVASRAARSMRRRLRVISSAACLCKAATLGPPPTSKGSTCYWEVVSIPLFSQHFLPQRGGDDRTDVW